MQGLIKEIQQIEEQSKEVLFGLEIESNLNLTDYYKDLKAKKLLLVKEQAIQEFLESSNFLNKLIILGIDTSLPDTPSNFFGGVGSKGKVMLDLQSIKEKLNSLKPYNDNIEIQTQKKLRLATLLTTIQSYEVQIQELEGQINSQEANLKHTKKNLEHIMNLKNQIPERDKMVKALAELKNNPIYNPGL